MESLAAFSLAAGVLQVIAFSYEAIKACRELHNEGSLAEHKEIEEITDALGR